MQDAIDIDDLARRVGENEDVLLHCTASWNSRYDDELETLLDEVRVNGGRVRALRLDTDDTRSWPTLRSWGVLTLPALIFFRGGGRVGMLQGLRPLAELERVLTGWYGGRDAT